jgi:tripeptide aminopeptidase
VSDHERARLHETFAALCRIPSPTGRERACADWLTRELEAMGLDVHEDGAGAQIGADAGNLLVRVPGRGDRWLMLCAHMDTVPLTAPLEPVLVDGGWENAGEGILGADNKSAVAALVELARRAAAEPLDTGLELLFTISEETGLHGATAFDVTQLHSEFGYVFDHASPLGEIIVASPTHMRIRAEIRGRAAHAGLQPEAGVSAIRAAAHAVLAMPQGRLDAETTANVGTIEGGTADNVVPERCRIGAEVRSIDPARVQEVVTHAVDALQDAADAAGCDLDVKLQRMFTGYRLRPAEPAIVLAERALRATGYEPRLVSSGGGSDANAFRAAGFACVNIANGTERPHEPTERVSSEALEAGLALAMTLAELHGRDIPVAAATGEAGG